MMVNLQYVWQELLRRTLKLLRRILKLLRRIVHRLFFEGWRDRAGLHTSALSVIDLTKGVGPRAIDPRRHSSREHAMQHATAQPTGARNDNDPPEREITELEVLPTTSSSSTRSQSPAISRDRTLR